MRRIAATALTVGTLIAGVAGTAAPAQAATAWTSADGFKNVKASGVYSRLSSKVSVKFRLSDLKKDNNAACVRFRFEEGTSIHYQKFWLRQYINGKWVLLDRKATVTGGSATDANTTHFYVQECGIGVKSKKTYYGKWKKLF